VVDDGPFRRRTALVATRDIPGGEVALEIPGDQCITAVDAGKSPVAPVAEGRSDLVQLALWLMRERSAGAASEHAPLVASLPAATLSPLLWSEAELDTLLRGSPVAAEARSRVAALRAEWEAVEAAAAAHPGALPDGADFAGFLSSFCAVLAHATYLEAASCFALVPLLGCARRTCAGGACGVDYDADRGSVIVVTDRMTRRGAEVAVADGRPNAEMLLACGAVERPNPQDFLEFPAQLLAADRMYTMKRQLVEQEGFSADQSFPIYADAMPTQMLAFLRLSRLSDVGQLPLVNFQQDSSEPPPWSLAYPSCPPARPVRRGTLHVPPARLGRAQS